MAALCALRVELLHIIHEPDNSFCVGLQSDDNGGMARATRAKK